MTDETNVDAVGAGGTPNPPASPAPVADADALVKLVRSAFDEALKPIKGDISGLYSRQDKDRNAFSEFMTEFKKQKGKGLDDDAAEAAANTALQERGEREQERALIRAMSEKLGLVPPKSVGNGDGGAGDAAKFVAEFGLDENSPEVTQALREASGPALEARLARIALKSQNKQPPSPAGAPAMGAAPTHADKVDVDGLAAEHSRLMKNPTANMKRLAEIQAELAKAG